MMSGGRIFNHVHGVTGDLGQDAMLGEHLGHDHLGEEDLVDLVQKLPRHLELKLVRLVELDRDHETLAAHFLDEGMFGAERVDALDEELTHARGVLDQLLVVEHFERGEAAGHGEIVAAESGGMDHATIHPAEGLLVNLASRHDRAAGDIAAAQGLGQGNDVRLEIPMLEAKHLAGASEAGLDFVANQKGAVFSAKLLGAVKEIAARIIHALALYRLDDEGGDIAFRQFALKGRRDHRARCGHRIPA